jgi:hypothetical protein
VASRQSLGRAYNVWQSKKNRDALAKMRRWWRYACCRPWIPPLLPYM